MALASLFVSEHGALARWPTPNPSRPRGGEFRLPLGAGAWHRIGMTTSALPNIPGIHAPNRAG